MKTPLIILISLISLSFSSAQDKNAGDPIRGADVKVGRKPQGAIVALGKIGADGSFEFKNLPLGKGYFVVVDYSIRDNGIKSTSQSIEISDIEISKATETYIKKMKEGSGKQQTKDNKTANKAEENEIVLTVTTGNGTIKVRHDTVKNSINNIR